ncbi:MAG: S-methyl-5-thioribose-1-phosphate isomerase [Desulfovibrionaceae bacterium]
MESHINFDSQENILHLLDQRLLPTQEIFVPCHTSRDVINALQTMVVRGAPAIGVTAAWGCVLALVEVQNMAHWRERLEALLADLTEARPTAVNLRWAVDKMRFEWRQMGDMDADILLRVWRAEAARMQREDIAINKALGAFGATCIKDGDGIMTHCNAGALATAGYGTALGVIRAAWEEGKKIHVIANETRPFLQGARLTAFELAKEGIPVSVACDNACGLLMRKGLVQCVVVGADRIAANGDTANKIGTYSVALLAKAHAIPFYIAAPLSTIDRDTDKGADIPIEVRPEREVTHIGPTQLTPNAVPVFNFAFDVTPAELISGIITEKGILRAPYTDSILNAFEA